MRTLATKHPGEIRKSGLRRGATLLLVTLLLFVTVPLGITALNGHFSRALLRDQVALFSASLGAPWRLDLLDLNGGFNTSAFKLALLEGPEGVPLLSVVARVQHHLLHVDMEGEVESAGAPMTAIRGAVSLSPGGGPSDWSLELDTTSRHYRHRQLNWKLAGWTTRLHRRGAALELGAEFPQVGLAIAGQGHGIAMAQHLRVHGRGVIEGRERALELHVTAEELVYKGVPFTRLTAPTYTAQGTLRPAVAGTALAWSVDHELTARSDYGPLRFEATSTGIMEPSGWWRLDSLRLHGRIPPNLWGVLERLDPPWTARLVEDGIIRAGAGEVTVGWTYSGDATE